jgi:flagellar biogenesis protein FliO
MRRIPCSGSFGNFVAAAVVMTGALFASSAFAIDPTSNDVITPSAKAAQIGKDSASGKASDGMMAPMIFAVVAVVVLGAYFFVRYSRNRLGKFSQNSQGAIEICRTRSLGSKQFLVVVQVEGRRMLIGVGPTFMTHLCDLESEEFSIPFERKGQQVNQPLENPPQPEKSNPSFQNLITRINDSLSHKGPENK